MQLVKTANTEAYETERLIQRSLDRLAAERTTFAIAHRLSTMKDADAILVIEDGRIAERGTDEELIEREGRPPSSGACRLTGWGSPPSRPAYSRTEPTGTARWPA